MVNSHSDDNVTFTLGTLGRDPKGSMTLPNRDNQLQRDRREVKGGTEAEYLSDALSSV